MKKNCICTTLEQSKQLLKLGIDSKTADMHYYIATAENITQLIQGYNPEAAASCENTQMEYIPAWTVGALQELMPCSFEIHRHPSEGREMLSFIYVGYTTEIIGKSILDATYRAVSWILDISKQ